MLSRREFARTIGGIAGATALAGCNVISSDEGDVGLPEYADWIPAMEDEFRFEYSRPSELPTHESSDQVIEHEFLPAEIVEEQIYVGAGGISMGSFDVETIEDRMEFEPLLSPPSDGEYGEYQVYNRSTESLFPDPGTDSDERREDEPVRTVGVRDGVVVDAHDREFFEMLVDTLEGEADRHVDLSEPFARLVEAGGGEGSWVRGYVRAGEDDSTRFEHDDIVARCDSHVYRTDDYDATQIFVFEEEDAVDESVVVESDHVHEDVDRDELDDPEVDGRVATLEYTVPID